MFEGGKKKKEFFTPSQKGFIMEVANKTKIH